MAPSWIALAISRMVGVPSSAASTPRTSTSPTAMASTATAAEKINQPHSPAFSVNDW